MDTNDDRGVDVNEFITFFARRNVEGGWLKREQDPRSEVLTLENNPAIGTDANSSMVAEDKPANDGNKINTKTKGGKKKKKKRS